MLHNLQITFLRGISQFVNGHQVILCIHLTYYLFSKKTLIFLQKTGHTFSFHSFLILKSRDFYATAEQLGG